MGKLNDFSGKLNYFLGKKYQKERKNLPSDVTSFIFFLQFIKNSEKYKPLTLSMIQFDLFVNLGDVVTVCGVVKVVADEASARSRKINY